MNKHISERQREEEKLSSIVFELRKGIKISKRIKKLADAHKNARKNGVSSGNVLPFEAYKFAQLLRLMRDKYASDVVSENDATKKATKKAMIQLKLDLFDLEIRALGRFSKTSVP